MKYLIFALLLTLLTGCYQMPGENDFSVIPTTNNPDVAGHRESGTPTPKMEY